MTRLIALDLDGTLVDRDLRVSDRARRAIADAHCASIRVVAATGRGFVSAGELLTQVPEVTTAVCANGACVRDLRAGETLHEWTLDPVVLGEVNAAVAKDHPQVAVAWEMADGTFEANDVYLALRPDKAHEWPEAEVDAWPTDGVLKAIARDPGRSEAELHADLEPVMPPGVEITYSGYETVEITGAGVHKAAALAWLCERWGIDAADVVAVGDNRNDIEMLRWAGRSFAMGGSTDAVVAAATTTTASQSDDGVAKVIEGALIASSR